MSVDYLNTITENASRLGMRIQESLSEHTREMNLARSNVSYLEADDSKGRNIRKQLDSSSDREKLDAMKRLIAFISKGRNVSEYFAQVVKNVASQNLEIRKLVYIYVLRYAEQEPDLALLSINTFQKDLNDSNPFIRAMALRVLSGIRVPMVGNIVVLAIKKCAADFSPYVRKVAALAIPKCSQLDDSHLPSLIETITKMLNDTSPLSIGSVAVAFEAVCPTRLDLIHQRYRRLCKLLVEVDEWGQIDLLNLLLRYARTMLPRPIVNSDGEEVDHDIELLLSSAEPLLQSRNPAVVLAVVRVFWYAGPPSVHVKVVRPLLRLLHISKEVERVTLSYILVLARINASLFSPHYVHFFMLSDDSRQAKAEKIRLLVCLINLENHQPIFRELIEYTEDPNDQVVADCIAAIGKCAKMVPESMQTCLAALTEMIKNNHDVVVSNAILVLKYLVQTQLSQISGANAVNPSQSSLSIISSLARKIDDIRHPQARACVVWLVGQYCASDQVTRAPTGIAEWAPDVLRKTAKTFPKENVLVKLQIITLAAKLLVLDPAEQTLGLIAQYVFSLARYDLNYDVRDRARVLSSLLAGVGSPVLTPDDGITPFEERGGVVLRSEQVKVVLFNGKTNVTDDEHAEHSNMIVGALGVIVGITTLSDTILPDWHEEGVESTLRDSPDDTPVPPASNVLSVSSSTGSTTTVLHPSRENPPSAGLSATNGRKWASNLDDFFKEDVGSDNEASSEYDNDDSDEEYEDHIEGEDEEDEHDEQEGQSDEGNDEEEENSEEGNDEDRNSEENHKNNETGYEAFG
ncbi:adaptin N terminal region-domain-containing protein [Lentinula aff. lateritia]|uniref:Adaptin N terminal region-domain-containing protein n=1 Tax=Lentinula aff. lateritia TaxID=2804960 RepID=A0ACC1U3D7_9AGAR|nr:adaptin N terminal region-domain-containing protein [Lentinula aff. lateritia]